MIASLSSSVTLAHLPISASVRPQPTQMPVSGSRVQWRMQGEVIGEDADRCRR